MKKIRKILMLILIISMCLNFGTLDSKAAASVSISLSNATTSIGGSVSVTITVSGSDISAYDIYVSYDSSVLQYNSGSGSAQANGGGGTVRLVGTGAGSTTLSFTAVGNGSCYISTSGSECYDINYNQISISHGGANVTVATPTNDNNNNDNNNNNNNDNNDRTEEQTTTEEDDRSSNCNLKSLQISPGTLEPAFSPSITSYYVQVDEDVTSMVVSAVAEDENAATAVRGAGLIEPGANTVTITVTAENGAVKVYTLSVAAGEVLGDAKTTIDGIDYDFVQSSNDLEIPEGYSEIKTEYKEWEVLAFESPNKKIVLVCLKPNVENDEDDRQEWFMYDKDKESFIPYREYSSEFNRYVIIEAPEGKIIPEGFEKTEIDIGGIGEKVIAYKSNDINDKDIYLVYAVNIAGDEGFYWYDTKEKAFLRYAEKEVVETDVEVATETMATPAEPEIIEEKTSEKEGFFSNKTLGVMAIIFGVLAFIFLVVIIILSAMLKAKGNEEDAFEDEEAFSSEENSKVSGELSDKDISENNNDLADTDGLLDESAENRIENNELTEEMAYEEARRAYEEDREISHSIPASFDLSNMQDDKTVEDRNIQIMSFKKPEKKEVISEDKSDSSSEKENDKNIVETEKEKDTQTDTQINEVTEMEEIETIKFDFSKSDTEVKEDEELRKDYENDYAKQSEAINEKIKNGYDAEKDSAFSDDSDE